MVEFDLTHDYSQVSQIIIIFEYFVLLLHFSLLFFEHSELESSFSVCLLQLIINYKKYYFL